MKQDVKHDAILQALRAVAENDRDRKAPPEVESRLLRQFAVRQARKRGRRLAVLGLAAALVLTGILSMNRGQKFATGKLRTAPQSSARTIERLDIVPVPVASAATPAVRKAVPKPAKARNPELREVVTDFFPLMNPAPPFERGQMLRVELPAAAMQTVGLPVTEEHLTDLVQADVLLGEEGLPRAIRFVRFEVE